MKTVAELNDIVKQVRRDIVRMVHAVQSGHPGGSLGCAEYFTVLYQNTMSHSAVPFNMDGKNEDVFVLSNGHISPVFYSTLAHSGYFDKSELATFRKLESRLQGHPATEEGLPGIRIASGSLGQGLSVSVGIAQSKKLNKDAHNVYVLMGDGELQEGQNWEAIMYAGHNKVDNLIATVDFNKAQIDGSTTDIMGFHELNSKFESFGWDVMEMDGNDVESVNAGLEEAKTRSGNGKPVVIIMKTEMGNGVDFMMGSHKWHGIPPNDEQLASALDQNISTIGDY
ncbi:MAG: transketolase [Bacteroidetes bacterium]|nr:transketolase [Bacteroidota bacterium]